MKSDPTNFDEMLLQVCDVLAEMENGADATYAHASGIQKAFIMQQAREVVAICVKNKHLLV